MEKIAEKKTTAIFFLLFLRNGNYFLSDVGTLKEAATKAVFLVVLSFFLECEMFSLIKKFHNKKSSQNERQALYPCVCMGLCRWNFNRKRPGRNGQRNIRKV